MRFLAPTPLIPVEAGSEPTVSVLIPSYQAAGTVGAAVASALAQTSPPHEVIVCDDGSTDDTESALAGYRDRITLLRKENGGGASALNHAAQAATGELVAILDSDDVYDPRRLEAIRALAAERPDLDIIATDAWLERDGERAGRYFEVNPFDVEDQRSSILSTCYPGGMAGAPPRTAARGRRFRRVVRDLVRLGVLAAPDPRRAARPAPSTSPS